MIAPLEIHRPELLDVVALLIDRPDLGLSRGAAGTIVETLDDFTALVEFSSDSGEAVAVAARPYRALRGLN